MGRLRVAGAILWSVLLAGCAPSDGSSGPSSEKGSDEEATVRYVPVPKERQGFIGSDPEIYVAGTLTPRTLDRIKALVQKHKLEMARVQFDSPGGDLMAGVDIGYYLREQAFATDVGAFNERWGESFAAECHSACTLAFLGGKFRYFDSNSRYGVHRFYGADEQSSAADTEQEAQLVSGYIVSFIQAMGVDVALFERMSEQHSDDVEMLDIDEMRRLGIINEGRLPAEWDHQVDADGLALVGFQESADSTASVVLSCGAPLDMQLSEWNPSLKDIDVSPAAVELVLLTGGEERSTDARELFRSGTGLRMEDENIMVDLRPLRRQVTQLLGGQAIGLRYSLDDSNYEFRIDFRSAQDRKLIADFVAYCERTSSTEP